MTNKIKNIVSIFVIGMILQSCGEEMGGVECIRFDVEDFKHEFNGDKWVKGNWDDSEITTVDGVDDVVIYKYKGEKFTGTICYDFGSIDNTEFSFDDHRKYGKISKVGNKSLEEIERSIKFGSKKTPDVSAAPIYRAFQARITYENGLKNGLEIGWAKYSDDRIDTAYVINWKNGYVDGKCIWYAKNDDFDYDESYNPNPCDTCKAFSKVLNFKKGKADGPFLAYGWTSREKDKNIFLVKREGIYKSGRLQGKLITYDLGDQWGEKRKIDAIWHWHKGNLFAKKFINKDGSFDGGYSSALTINLDYPKEDSIYSYPSSSYEAVPFDTVINGKKYQFGEKDYNRWEYINGDLIQTRKNGKSSNIKLADTTEIKDWGKLIYIVK